MSLFEELKRRKVFKVAAAYAVVGWLVIEVASTVLPQFNVPDWAPRLVTLLVAFGFPLALVLAWVLEVTPEGVKVTSGKTGTKRFFTLVAVITALAAGWFLRGHETGDGPPPQAKPAEAMERSIAVLPFVNMSADPSEDYFSDGISEELLNRLAKIPDLKVAARTSAFRFKGKNIDIGDIGRQLKVAHVLEGSVRKSGMTLRITAQLIDSRSGYHMWSETYDRDAADVFKVQDEIAGAIAAELNSKLGGDAAATTPARKISPAAYDDYLQGRSLIAKRYLDHLYKAVAAFERAIASEPDYIAAHSVRVFAQLLRPLWGAPDFEAALVRARDSANAALKLDPDNAEAYMVRGYAAYSALDATSAGADLDRALALAPGNVDVLNIGGDLDAFLARLGTAERRKRQAMVLDPLAFVHPMNLADVLSEQGRFQEAIVAARQSFALGGKDYATDRLIFASLRAGLLDQAKAETEKNCVATGQTEHNCEANRILLLANTGHRQQADALLSALVSDIRSGKHAVGNYTPSTLASLYAEVANFNQAAAWQRKAFATHDWFPTAALVAAPGGAKLPEEMSSDPEWLAVWADPAAKDLMAVYRRNLLAWRAGKD
ncbi:hypothetical protein BH11PSE14_BH11PSE14_05800 [soil metagenome]